MAICDFKLFAAQLKLWGHYRGTVEQIALDSDTNLEFDLFTVYTPNRFNLKIFIILTNCLREFPLNIFVKFLDKQENTN